MIPATAERASGNVNINAVALSIVYQTVSSDPNQMDIHHTQVNKYPNVVEGGKRFQTLFRSHSKITSMVISRARRYVAKERRIKWKGSRLLSWVID
jgi:hypothetical protein